MLTNIKTIFQEDSQKGTFLLFLLFLLFFPSILRAQLLYAEHEENFAYEVKQIDEFIERFNNENTLIRDYLSQKYNQMEVNRVDLLKSLFNLENPRLDREVVEAFIQQVNQPANPRTLSFYDEGWFARVKSSVLHEGREQELYLLLSIEQEKNGGSKWVIEEVYADFLKAPEDMRDSTAFLNPMSHATDFMGLSRAFEHPENIQEYLSSRNQRNQLSRFVKEMQNHTISFQHVEDISYHFLQIDGWIFTVDDFQRQGKNAGWLISNLMPADEKEKEDYRQNLLVPKI